ncbi:MAG: fibronectin type III domain-containing protein [bacterium]|nr:fibronectin type III domain-containing protein [bacterium]
MSRLIAHPNSFLRPALAVLAALALAAPAAAQTTLVSNLGKTTSSATSLASNSVAVQFTAGNGGSLTAIVVDFSTAPSGVTVKVATGDTNVDNLVSPVTLSNPSSFAVGNNTFTAPANTVLSASTYWVVIEGTSGNLPLVFSDAEDLGAAKGWSIADAAKTRTSGGTGPFTGSLTNVPKISVRGTAFTAPPAPPAPSVSTASTTSLRVAWRAPLSDGGRAITDYDVRWKERFQADTEWTEIADTTASTARHTTVTGLSAGKTYDVQVRAQNAVGNGAWSASARGTTWAVPAVRGTRALSAPTTTCTSHCPAALSSSTVTGGPGSRQVTVDWTWAQGTEKAVVTWELSIIPLGDTNPATTVSPASFDPNARSLTATLPASYISSQHGRTQLSAGDRYRVELRAIVNTVGSIRARREMGWIETYVGKLPDPAHAYAPEIERVRIVSSPTHDSGGGRFDTYARGDTILVDVELNAPVTVTGANSDVNLKLAVGANTRSAPLDQVLYGDQTLRFAYEVVAGDTDTDQLGLHEEASKNIVFLSGTPAATIVGTDNGVAADLRFSGGFFSGATRSKVDGTVTSVAGPVPESATMNGRTLTVTFNKALGSVYSPDLVQNFLVQGAGPWSYGDRNAYFHPERARRNTNNTRQLILEMDPNNREVWARAGDEVTLTHSFVTGKQLTDTNGNAAPAFRDFAVTNTTPGTGGPLPVRADVAGTSLRIEFDRALKTTSVPAASAFTVQSRDADNDHWSMTGTGTVVISGAEVLVTLDSAVGRGEQVVRASYAKPSTNPLQDTNGNDAPAFTGYKVKYNVDVRGPAIADAAMNATGSTSAKTVLYFDEPLDMTSVPAPGDFEFEGVGNTATTEFEAATSIVEGNSVVLTHTLRPKMNEWYDVTYTAGTNPILDRSGNPTTFTEQRVRAYTTGQGVFRGAQVDGATVKVSMVQALDPAYVPAPSAFGLWALDIAEGQTERRRLPHLHVVSVALERHLVVLELSRPVNPCSGTQVFRLSYDNTVDNHLRSYDGTVANKFGADHTHNPVTNDRASWCGRNWLVGSRTGSVILRSRRPFARDRGEPQPGWFTVSASGGPVRVTGAAFSADDPHELELEVDRSFARSERVTVSYRRPAAADGLWDVDGKQLADVVDAAVTNESPAATAPAFDDGAAVTLTVAENHADGAVIGTVAATDEDGDRVSYWLSGDDAESFEIGAKGAISVRRGIALNHEAQASYVFTAKVTDGEDATGHAEGDPVADDTIEVTVEVTDVREPPGAVTDVTVARASRTSLSVSWTAPADPGAVPVSTYDLRWFAGGRDPRDAADWTEVLDVGAGTSATLEGLQRNTAYRVQVRAVGQGAGPWSASANGHTGTAAPLTAELRRVPSGHDGARPFAFEIVFSEEFHGLRLSAFGSGALEVANGRFLDAERVVSGENRRVRVRVRPAGEEDVTVTLVATADCGAAGAVCTTDGRRLSNTVSATVSGPEPAVVNTPATGAPGISGEARVGETLTATTDGIADADGLGGASFAFQWVSGGNRGDADITGATGSSYTLAKSDEGRRIKVRASFTDDAGHAEVLTSAATAAVEPLRPLTAEFRGVPGEHDGARPFGFEVVFSEDFAGLRLAAFTSGALAVTGGRVVDAQRATRGSNRVVSVRVRPASHEDVAVTLQAAGSCPASDAVCAADGRGLSNSVSARVTGPPGLSVADARVEEAAGAVLEFAVRLDRAASGPVTVDYRTMDGSAKAGEDYDAASGTLTFAAGETSRSVRVTVRDDEHDEGEETLALRLSNPSGAWMSDREGTGTIVNRDLMPAALLARFGRSTAEQVVDQVEERMSAPREGGFRAQLLGREYRPGTEGDFALGFLSSFSPMGTGAGAAGGAGLGAAAPAGSSALAGAFGADTSGLGGLTAAGGMTAGGGVTDVTGRQQPGRGGARGGGLFGSLAPGGDLLSNSGFELNRASHGGTLSVWSRSSRSYFNGMEGALSLNGDVRTTMFGADWARGPLTVGLSVGHTRGLGGYEGRSAGAMTTAMTGFYPWLGYRVNDRVSVWAVSGYGRGSLALTPEGAGELETGMSMAMTAVGTRGELFGSTGGLALAFKADALWVGATTELLEGPAGRLNASETGVTRVRTALEGSRGFALGGGRVSLTPTVEVGLRRDGGDAETGAGLDLGGGLVFMDAVMGLSLDVRVRTLLAHQAEGFAERGLSVSFGWDPAPGSPLGLSARLMPSWGGSATGGAEALWGGQLASGSGSLPVSGAGGGQLDAEVGYGLPVGARFVGTPRLGLRSSTYGREYRAGWGLGVLDTSTLNLDLGLEAQRRESPTAGGAGNGLLARATLSW